MSLVTIIIPCYNQSKFLSETLESVLNQTYSNWECIIINDGSTDNVESIAKQWCEKDKRFIYLYKTNGGPSSARNAGLKMATGEFIQFLDGDDFIHPEKLKSAVEIFEKDPTKDIVLTDFLDCDDSLTATHPPWCTISNKVFSYEGVLLKWDTEYSIPIHCAVIRHTILQDFQFNLKLKAKEDWLLWLYIFKKTSAYALIAKPYAIYRHHHSEMTKDPVHMYRNEYEAYKHIAENEELGHLMLPFFNRVNETWNRKVASVISSKNYRLGEKILKSYGSIKRVARSFKLV